MDRSDGSDGQPTVFYLVIFGRDEVRWMFINAFLGLLGIYSQIGWLLSFFGKKTGITRITCM